MLIRLLLAALLPFAALPITVQPLAAQDSPAFEQRDPSKLRCRVASIDTNKAKVTVLEVVVTNGTNCTAEPLRFVIDGKGRKRKNAMPQVQRFERARMPLVGRFGEGIAPGKSRRYFVQAYLPKSRKPKVRVGAACFYRNAPARGSEPKPVVRGLKAARGTNQFLGQTFDIVEFALHNPLPRAADIWIRADYTRPVKDQLLLAYRVPAGQTRSIELGVLPHAFGFDDSEKSFATNVKIAGIEVVDWIQIGEVDHASAKKAFVECYAAWHRWPDGLKQARAKFSTLEEAANRIVQADVKVKISGTLTVGRDRRLTVELDKRSKARMAKIVKAGTGFTWSSGGFLQSQATRYLRRRSAAKLREGNELKWIDATSVQLLGPAFEVDSSSSWTAGSDGYAASAPRFELDKGRIVRDGWGMEESNDWAWESDTLDQGWVLAKRHSKPRSSSRAQTETWKHALQDGYAVPLSYQLLVTNNDKLETTQTVRFSNWQFDLARVADASEAKVRGPAPVGVGAQDLSAAWSKLHLFPAARPAWTAKLAVKTNGTDLSWQGHSRFAGIMQRKGFGTRKPELRLDLRGAASSKVEADLASVYLDRLGMWFGSDPQSMGPFAQAFAGATIGARNQKGWHRIDNHMIAQVRVRGGKVTEFRLKNGVHRRFHYEEFDGVSLITRIERDVARKTEVIIRPARLGQWIVPTRYEFRRIFGSDWGPEIFTLSRLRLLD